MATKIAIPTDCNVPPQKLRVPQNPPAQKLPKQVVCSILRPDEYAEWDELVDRSDHGTVFHYSWWLQTTADSSMILGIRNDRGTLVAGMPIPHTRRSGLRLLHSPDLTPYLGPVFDLTGIDNTCDRLHFMRSHGEVLGRNIKSFDSIRYVAGASAPDLQGFLWAGFRVHLAYTFRFPASHTPTQITEGMTRTHLQKLTKAQRAKLTVTRDEDVEALIFLNGKTFEKQGLKPAHSPEFIKRLWDIAHSRGHARLYVAKTDGGNPVAALLTVNDKRTTYQIVSGVNPEHREIPGAYLVLWNALQDTLLAGRDFDFEGSGLRGVECFYRRWGATAVPVWRLEKAGSWRGGLFQSLVKRRDLKALDS